VRIWKPVLCVCLVGLAACSAIESAEIKQDFPRGTWRGYMVQGRKDGLWRFYRSGDLHPQLMETYVDGELNGPTLKLMSGRVIAFGYILNGKPIEPHVAFNLAGEVLWSGLNQPGKRKDPE